MSTLREAVERLAEEATQRAYRQIAHDKMLTIQCVPGDLGRALVPGHWRDEAEAAASVAVGDLRALLAEHPPTPAEEVAEVAVEEREALAELLMSATNGEHGFGYHDCESTSDRREGCGIVADALMPHIAALTAKAKAEAWDEGYGSDEECGVPRTNPYREAT